MGIDPATLSTIATVAGGLKTGFDVFSSLQQGQAQIDAYNYQSQVNANNAEMARRNASQAALAGEQKVAIQQMETRQKIGALKAQQAASGVDTGSGSALDVRSSAAELGQLNAITIRSNAVKEAYGYQVQGANYDAQSVMDKSSAKNASTAGYINAGASLFNGASSLLAQNPDLFGKQKETKALDGNVGTHKIDQYL